MNIKYPNISQFDCTLGICQISESYTQYCRKFYYTGFYLLLLCISSLSLNLAVFVAYLKKKKSSIDIQIMVILVSNLVAAVFCLPSLKLSLHAHNHWFKLVQVVHWNFKPVSAKPQHIRVNSPAFGGFS